MRLFASGPSLVGDRELARKGKEEANSRIGASFDKERLGTIWFFFFVFLVETGLMFAWPGSREMIEWRFQRTAMVSFI